MGVISGRGINQGELVTLLRLIRTNFVAVLGKLDSDTAVTDTDYASSLTYAFPVTISESGIFNQGSVLDHLKTIRTKFNALLTKLDADTLVTDTNYSATLALADQVDNLALGSLTQSGVYEGALIKWLSNYLTKYAALLAKLDADCTATDFLSTQGITAGNYIDATGCVAKP